MVWGVATMLVSGCTRLNQLSTAHAGPYEPWLFRPALRQVTQPARGPLSPRPKRNGTLDALASRPALRLFQHHVGMRPSRFETSAMSMPTASETRAPVP